MTQTKKFSQFNGPDPIQSTDIVVGLRNGDNWQFTGVGSGGGGGVTEEITQPGQTFVKGQWVRIDVGTMLYELAQADTTANAEVIGVVISSDIPAGTFVLQQSGYINASQAVFAGLSPGVPQFLSTSSLGAMQPMDVTVDGQISRPVFIPDGIASGWVVPYRGIITDGGPNTGTSSSGGGGDSNVITVTQDMHGFSVGDVLYVIAPVAGQATYARAKADNFATSQVAGVVIEVLNANQFMLQFSGYNLQTGGVGGITTDDLGNPVVASTVYYLSSTSSGKVTSVKPTSAGTFSRPVFISERTVLSSGVYSGWILPQKPTDSVITVAEGGTGDATFTPNSVISAGATSTSPLVSIVPGPAGTILTSNGPLLPATFQAVGGSSAFIFLGYLNNANNFQSTTILQDGSGNTYFAYFIIIQPATLVGGRGINGTSAGPNVGVGFQIYSGGAWVTGSVYGVLGGGYKTVSNTNVATAWGMAYTGGPAFAADNMFILPPTSRSVSLNSGHGFMTVRGDSATLNFNMFAVDYGNFPVSQTAYTSIGIGDAPYPVTPTGLRVYFYNGTLTAGSTSYIAVYGIPNA